ncbi:MAG TPA: Uma2 family endonuclease [Pseudonocardia sp.]|nr:Uma2 family endonuclease [Pseudonocardia sp.]
MDHPVFGREGPWSESAYLELPRADRVEVVDGTLLVGPGTSADRAAAVARVRESMTAALPDGLRVRGPVSLRLGPDCVLMPDLVVTTAAEPAPDGDPAGSAADGAAEDDAEVLDAAAALMVVEVVGREHGAVDRTFKPQLYARSRIPYLLLVDHHGPFAIADMIISGRYHEYAGASGDQVLRLEEPFPLELDLAACTAPAGPTEPQQSRSAESRSTESQPAESQPAESQPTESQPTDPGPAAEAPGEPTGEPTEEPSRAIG